MTDVQSPLRTDLISWLDDLTVRFLLNLPSSELSSVPRLCFQVEEAQWFYEDFIRPAVAASGALPLPSLPLRSFCLLLFQHCPLLSGFTDAQHIAAYEEFLAYKVRVPVRGAILLDEAMEKVVLVRGWKKGASWSFPRGKINKDERDLDCAVREVWEETGFDVREAGLVDETKTKYIDITMREQHMRLFVFRGVDEATHFEPRTRKEISKISWYAVKDLPGYSKRKGGGDAAAQANKFYMVAPFLAPLKKWIGQQRRRDEEVVEAAAEDDVEVAQTTTEDEGEVEMEVDTTPERDALVEDKSETLKRLLSIGNPPSEPAPAKVEPPPKSDTRAGNLLAMLQGGPKPTNGNQLPHTPFEQMNPFPPPTMATPQPDHFRHPSTNQQQQRPAPPQFPFSPQGVQHGQRNYSVPTPSVFGPGPGHGFQQHPQQPYNFHGIPPPPQQHQQQQPPFQQQHQQQRGSIPGMPFGAHNGMPPTNNQHAPPPPPHMQFHQQHQPPPLHSQQHRPPPHMQHQPPQPPPQMQQHQPSSAYQAQGPQGAIANGPAVPKASQLPAPRLDAGRLRLLETLKGGVGSSSGSRPTQVPTQQRAASTVHQSALLDLFRKPSNVSEAVQEEVQVDGPPSPTSTDRTIRPTPGPAKRKTTLNEITRTLPARLKVKSPTRPPAPPVFAVDEAQFPASELQEKQRQLFDPSHPTKFSPALASRQVEPQQSPQPPSATLASQPPPSKRTSRSPRLARASPARAGVEEHQQAQVPAYTILPRPGPSKGPQSPGLVAPARSEATAAGSLKVLKRADEVGLPAIDVAPAHRGEDKRDQLLALFGKGAASPTPSPVPAQVVANATGSRQSDSKHDLMNLLRPAYSSSQRQPTPASAPASAPPREVPQPKDALLNFFNSSSPAPASKPTPTQPQAPCIHASSSTHTSKPAKPRQQDLLLNLFHPKDKAIAMDVTSPGTPISPFTLGTPAEKQSFGVEESRRAGSRLSGGGTPVEGKSKEFLMGFLNDVVVREGGGAGGKR